MSAIVQKIWLRDLGFRAQEEKFSKIFERYCADSRVNSHAVYGGRLLDLAEFGPEWNFHSSFSLNAELSLKVSQSSGRALFTVLSPQTIPGTWLHSFEYSQHLELASTFANYKVPRFLFGYRGEQSPYVRAVKRLQRSNKILVLDGKIEFERHSTADMSQVEGLLSVSAFLPRYDYVGEHLAKFF